MPTTGKEFVGWLRGPHSHHRTNGLWVIDNPKWDGDPEHMPRRQALCLDIEPVTGKELEDIVINDLAQRVLDDGMSRDDAAKEIVRTKKISRAKADEQLDAAVADLKAQRRQASAAAKPARRVSARPAAKEPMEKVPPERFAALRDELGMSNKQCAAAQEEAGLGSTLSRVTELTHSKGAGIATFTKVEAAWRKWAKAHKRELAKPAE